MFSANENLQLRQYKRKIVEYVESCIPESVLDLGVNVMVMQVTCKAPGCVPLETAIVIVFPASETELLPGLPQSKGGSYKTKVLKPMSAVTKDDILEALPPEFPGGLRSIEKLCKQARDVMLGQITQLFGDESDFEGRKLMAQYLQQCLQDYIDRDCVPPEIGEDFPALPKEELPLATPITHTSGNLVIRRPLDYDSTNQNHLSTTSTTPNMNVTSTAPEQTQTAFLLSSSSSSAVDSIAKRRQQQNAEQKLSNQSNPLARLAQREHAPGVRRRGCPCCDPDDPSNVVDRLMQL